MKPTLHAPSRISPLMLIQSIIASIIYTTLYLLDSAHSWPVPRFGQMTYDNATMDALFSKDWPININGREMNFRMGTPTSIMMSQLCEAFDLTETICEETINTMHRLWSSTDYHLTVHQGGRFQGICYEDASVGKTIPCKDDDRTWMQEYIATRASILGLLSQKYGYQRYLEIGTDLNTVFDLARTTFPVAVGVDPRRGGTLRMTSDDFFRQLKYNNTRDGKQEMFELVFVDGMHEANQVYRDVMHSLQHLSPGGTIVMHDCNPQGNVSLKTAIPRPDPEKEGFYWNGDTWKATVALRMRQDLEIVIVDIDQG
jgi:hypothetical protein